MKKIFFTTIAASMLAVSANAAVSSDYAPGTGDNNSKCYWISTVEDLDAFAAAVGNDQDLAFSGGAFNKPFTPSTACAKLQNDINYSGDITVVSTSKNWLQQTTYSANNSAKTWKPIMFFGGVFDGQGHTIKGLYASQSWEPAFIRKAVGGLVVKNLTIDDAYFTTTNNGAGGIIGDVAYTTAEFNSKPVLINDCAVTNSYLQADKQNAGGFVGGVGDHMSLSVTNSYVANTYVKNAETSKCTSGGKDNYVLVGYVNPNTTIDILNCAYSTASNNNGCAYNGSRTDAAENVNKVSNARQCQDSIAAYKLRNANSAKLLATMDAEDLKEEKGIEGLEFDLEKGTDGSTKVRAVVGVLSETNGSVVIKDPIDVDAVSFDREFKSGVLSSIVMPFSIKAANVTNAKFYEFAGIDKKTNEEKPYWTVDIDPICSESGCGDQELQANHPYYVVKTTADEGALTFEGGVTLVATEGVNLDYQGDTEEYGNEWTFKGTYSYKKWEEGNSELGSVYGQAAKDAASGNYKAGDFVKISKNSYIKAMRAYLAYSPAVVGAKKRALAKTIASVEELPKTMVYRIRPYKGQESIENPEVEEGSEEEGTLGMTKAVKVPSSLNIMDRWYDSKGRRMNKPNSQGAFIKNGTPVIVK